MDERHCKHVHLLKQVTLTVSDDLEGVFLNEQKQNVKQIFNQVQAYSCKMSKIHKICQT